MSENGATYGAGTGPPRRSGVWVMRRLLGLIAPVIVLALAALIYLMFASVPADEGWMIDVVIVYGTALLSPMGLVALAGYLCAYSTRGSPAPRTGTVSLIINLLLTAVLIIPAMLMLPFFLESAPTMIPELFAWMGARLRG